MKTVLFALIPLILSIGITPALSFDFVPIVEAYGGGGGGGKPDPRVCGDKLCSEIPGGRDEWKDQSVSNTRNFSSEQNNYVASPKKQIQNGILPQDVICKEGKQLIFKPDNSPACVKPSTAEKLVERGWDIKKSIDEQLTAEGFGIISGSVRIGPLCPVEPCMIEIDPYSSRQLILTNEKGNVVLVNLRSDGSFSEIIPEGDYSVSLSDCDFFGCRFAVPQETTIVSGKTIFIELDIDTGIR